MLDKLSSYVTHEFIKYKKNANESAVGVGTHFSPWSLSQEEFFKNFIDL